MTLRIKAEDRSLIDRAAKTLGTNRTEFVLAAARAAAEETLLDQSTFQVSRKAYAAFLTRLDLPPEPNAQLLKTMESRPPWKTE